MSRLKVGSAEFIPLAYEPSPWDALHMVHPSVIKKWMCIPRTVVCRDEDDVMLINRMRSENCIIYPWLRTLTTCINELSADEARVIIGSDYPTVADWARSFGCDIVPMTVRNPRVEMQTGARYNPWLNSVEVLDADKFRITQYLLQSQGHERAESPSQLLLLQ